MLCFGSTGIGIFKILTLSFTAQEINVTCNQIHLASHGAFIKTPKFEELDENARQTVLNHYLETKKFIISEQMAVAQAAAPPVNKIGRAHV